MLRMLDRGNAFCDGLRRRSFLQAGAMGIGGLTLADLLAAEARADLPTSRKALINIFLGGGPSHQDMFDLKPDAPAEYRGEFQPIATNVAGVQICEHFPKLAKLADRFAVLRSVVGTYDDHSAFHTQTGYHKDDLKAIGGYPSVGSVVSKLSGASASAPPFVSFIGKTPYGYLGPTHQAFRPDGPGRQNLAVHSVSAERLRRRADLLQTLDGMKRDADAAGGMAALDSFTRRAVDLVSSGKMADALDPSKEDPRIRRRYVGEGGRSQDNERFLTARRLVEAGVRCVAIQWGGWDTHSNNFQTLRTQLPALDRGLSALLTDLKERGLDRDTMVVMWGEFGRTPRVNNTAGRDHWPRVMGAFVANGAMKMGQAIGSTDRVAGEAASRPVHLREVFATVYRHFGIDAKTTTLQDPSGRPQYLVDDREPIKELVG